MKRIARFRAGQVTDCHVERGTGRGWEKTLQAEGAKLLGKRQWWHWSWAVRLDKCRFSQKEKAWEALSGRWLP